MKPSPFAVAALAVAVVAPSVAHADGASAHVSAEISATSDDRPAAYFTFESAPVVSYLAATRAGAALMTLPLGATAQFLSTHGSHTWFSFHVSLFSPGVNWTGIKNPTPFYPSVLGAVAGGLQLHWQPNDAPDENGSFALELSLATVATGEAIAGDASRSLTAGAMSAITWTPGKKKPKK